MPCVEDNTEAIDQSSFWDENGVNWTAHRIGWAISGGCAILTVMLTVFSVWGHARHYYVPAEQRQIIRILYMPAIIAIISFFSYRFFRDYTYYSLVEVVYEAFVLSAFLLLIIQYVATTSSSRTAEDALQRKDKTKLPIPFCCLRYRPTKPYFMYTLKWSVMQYTIIRPACSITGIITQYYGVLCEAETSVHYAAIYIEVVDFISISVALMGLIVFYDLTKSELRGRRPLSKFSTIKVIVALIWYQAFVLKQLASHGIIKETEYWTSTNIADGLNALATCIEMVFFAIFMLWAYPSSEYINKDRQIHPAKAGEELMVPAIPMSPDEKKRRAKGKTSIWRPLWDSVNYSDFAREIWGSFVFFWDYARGKDYARSHSLKEKEVQTDFATAFGLEEGSSRMSMLRKNRSAGEGRRNEPDGRGLIRPRTPNSEAGTFALGTASVDAPRTEEGTGYGVGEAYRMSPISSQPRPRDPPGHPMHQPDSLARQGLYPPESSSGQSLSPDQPDPNQRWSRVGMAL